MFLTEEEREARDKGSIVIGVAHVGDDRLTGSIISCAVCLDYTKVSSNLIEKTLTGTFDKTVGQDVKDALKLVHFHKIEPLLLNSISDTEIATYMADFQALYGSVFEVFKEFSVDPDYILTENPIKEVIKNPELSVYKNKESKSNYVVMKDWNQLSYLIPNTTTKVVKAADTFTLLFAKAFANTLLDSELAEQKVKYPDYDFGCTSLSEKQQALLKEKGLTEYHRVYLPELSGFTFSKHILI